MSRFLKRRRPKDKVRDVFNVQDVFTPTRPARLNYVERSGIDNMLLDALRTPGKQLVIYGESGSGKSTLLRNKLREVHAGSITTQCSAAMSYEQLLLNAFDALDPYFVQSESSQVSRSISPSVEADFKAIKLAINTNLERNASKVRRRILPPQLTAQRLAVFLGELKICWVVEDFHKIREDEKTLYAQSLKIFSDMSDAYPEVKTITIGAAETAHQVVSHDSEMTKRVSELLVPLMSPEELTNIIHKGQRLLNISFEPTMTENIIRYSTGMPSICHQLALNTCLVQGIQETQSSRTPILQKSLQPAVNRWVDELSDTIMDKFARVSKGSGSAKSDNFKLILTALADGAASGMLFDEVLEKMHLTDSNYAASKLTSYLRELALDSNGGLVRCGADGRYRFAEPIYHTVAKATLIDLPRKRELNLNPLTRYNILEQSVAGRFLGIVYNAHSAPSVFSHSTESFFDRNIDFSSLSGYYDSESGNYVLTYSDTPAFTSDTPVAMAAKQLAQKDSQGGVSAEDDGPKA
jgi:AAA domain